MEHNLISPFGAPFLIEEIENGEEIADKFCDLSRDLRSNEDHGGLVSDAWREKRLARGQEDYKEYGFTSFATSNLVENPEFNFVHDAVCNQVSKYLDMNASSKVSFTIGNSWSTIYGEGHYVPEHIHPQSHLSCVFYGDATPDTGKIVFKNPMYPHYAMNNDQTFGLYTDSFFVQPKKGMMIIFPSWLPHYTQAHEDTKERIILSCNMNLSTGKDERDLFSLDGQGNAIG